VDVVAEHHLGDIQKYPLLIYTEWDTINPVFREKLLRYVNQGGKLLLVGPKTAALFRDEINVTFQGNPEVKTNCLEFNKTLADVHSFSQSVIPGKNVRPFGKYYLSWDMEGTPETAATITQYGKGQIGALYMDMGEVYLSRRVHIMRDFLESLVRELFPDPVVRVTGSHNVDVTLNKVKEKLVINLVNTAGPHENENVLVYEEIPEVNNLKVSVKYPFKPRKVMLQPSDMPLLYTFQKGAVNFTIDKLKIHDIIVIE